MNDEARTEALMELETRWLPMPGAFARELTYSLLLWRSLDYLIDQGHATLDELVAHAEQDGWVFDTLSFECRFSSVVAHRSQEADRWHKDYQDYCKPARRRLYFIPAPHTPRTKRPR